VQWMLPPPMRRSSTPIAPTCRERPAAMDDRGSATLLLPVGLLLMVALGAIAVDLGHLHGARTALQHRADAAANDAVTAGLDQGALRSGGGYRLDPEAALGAAARAAHIRPRGGLDQIRVRVLAISATEITVQVRAVVGLVFAPALPGGPTAIPLSATAIAVADIR
jgi:hypothetical protein